MYHVRSYMLKADVLHSHGQNITKRFCSCTIQNKLRELSTKGFAVTMSTDDSDETLKCKHHFKDESQNTIDSNWNVSGDPWGNMHT